MPRKFVDYIVLDSSSHLRATLEFSKLLGYSQIWLGRQWDAKSINANHLPKSQNLEVIDRLDVDSSKIPKEKIIQILRRERRNYPIISVKCFDPEIVGWASQDNRIDILVFPFNQISKLFTRSIAKLMIKFTKNLELSLSELYLAPERLQIPMFRQVKQALKIAQIKSVPVIINSGATAPIELRSPLELHSLFQVLSSKKEPIFESICEIPSKLLTRNQVKISQDYLAPGIYKARKRISQLEEEE